MGNPRRRQRVCLKTWEGIEVSTGVAVMVEDPMPASEAELEALANMMREQKQREIAAMEAVIAAMKANASQPKLTPQQQEMQNKLRAVWEPQQNKSDNESGSWKKADGS